MKTNVKVIAMSGLTIGVLAVLGSKVSKKIKEKREEVKMEEMDSRNKQLLI